MPVLTNTRHERFAQLIAQGKSASEAYELAGYKPSRMNAHHLLRDKPAVVQRVLQLSTEAAKNAVITVETLVGMARGLHDRAVESGQLSAGVAALKEMGILSGKRIERQEVGGPGEYEALNDDALERELAERIAQLGLDGGGSETQH